MATAYELSELTSYIRLSRIADDTYSHLKSTIDSLDSQHHSANYVIDLLDTTGEYGIAAVVLADSLLRHRHRFAFIIGTHTGGAAEQLAMFMRNAKRCVTLGTQTNGGLAPDIRYQPNESYLTQWYDSICRNNIFEKAAREYAMRTDVKGEYHNADYFLKNFKENGDLIGVLNEVAEREGIKQNDQAFYYSGFHAVSRVSAELLRVVFPESPDFYQKALNAPIQQVITDAKDIMESTYYRQLTN